ncbi:uncharacterized protein LOC135373581 [Ornithodoros turicata]|uniref:uncharacterized protein LOC135373581 n=1 Tax=Ornithodoros turicata TaxID=34597 RepID=UPI0031397383
MWSFVLGDKLFGILRYPHENNVVAVIHKHWLKDSFCMWPPKVSSSRLAQMVKNGVQPDATWIKLTYVELGWFSSYEEARRKLPMAEVTSDLQSDTDLGRGKRKRYRTQENSSTDYEDFEDVPRPPTPPCFGDDFQTDCTRRATDSPLSYTVLGAAQGTQSAPQVFFENERPSAGSSAPAMTSRAKTHCSADQLHFAADEHFSTEVCAGGVNEVGHHGYSFSRRVRRPAPFREVSQNQLQPIRRGADHPQPLPGSHLAQSEHAMCAESRGRPDEWLSHINAEGCRDNVPYDSHDGGSQAWPGVRRANTIERAAPAWIMVSSLALTNINAQQTLHKFQFRYMRSSKKSGCRDVEPAGS